MVETETHIMKQKNMNTSYETAEQEISRQLLCKLNQSNPIKMSEKVGFKSLNFKLYV